MPSSMGLTHAYREVIRVLAVKCRFSNDMGVLNSPLRTFYTNPESLSHPLLTAGGQGRGSSRESLPQALLTASGQGRGERWKSLRWVNLFICSCF